jgi:hypothetical protein
LLHGEDAAAGDGCLLDCSRDALGLAGEPPGEAERVIEFAEGFGEWFAGFVRDDLYDVFLFSRIRASHFRRS